MAKTKKKPAKKRAAKKSKKPAPRKAGKPKNQSLPGMEQARHADLDAFCEAIGDARDRKNRATQDEKGEVDGAIQAMRRKGVKIYKHAGVELVFVAGDDKLRVRLITDGGDGEDE